MINCACLIVNKIQIYPIWFILFLFAIDMVDLMYSVFICNKYARWQNDQLFFMPVKENDYRVSNWLELLSRTFSSYLFSL